MPIYTFSEYAQLPISERLNRARYISGTPGGHTPPKQNPKRFRTSEISDLEMHEFLNFEGDGVQFGGAAPPEIVRTPGFLLFNPVDVWDQTYGESYQISMYGVLTNGQKARVNITNVNPSFDVEIPENYNSDDFAVMLYNIFKTRDLEMSYQSTPILQKTFRGFTEPLRWLRVHFKKLKERNEALSIIKGKYHTGNDDGGNFRPPHNGYPLKAARENGFSLSSWNVISNYKVIKDGFPTVIEVDMRNIKAAPEHEQPIPAIVAYCDTETFGTTIGRLCNPEIDEEEMFIITTTFCRPFEKEKLDNLTICQFKGISAEELKTMITPANNDFIITADSEKEMLEAFITIYGEILPDMWIDFNGIGFDQRYFFCRLKKYNVENRYWSKDRGWVNETNDYSKAIGFPNKIVHYTLLDKFFNVITNRYDLREYQRPFLNNGSGYSENSFNWKKFNIKITADKMEYGNGFMLPGLFYVDARIVMMKQYPTDSASSLKFYLNKLGLPPKKDMPYIAMWGIFAQAKQPFKYANKEYCLQELIDYASWDAESCHAMFHKIDLYITRITNAGLTETSLYDEFYHAGGMKARNMLMSLGYKGVKDFNGVIMPMAFSVLGFEDVDNDTLDISYGGGYVVSPKFSKTGRTKLPVAPHDYASLYPSITMGYNICYSTAIRTIEEYNKYKDKYKFKKIDYALGEKQVKHSTWYVEYNFNSDNMEPGTELGMGVLPTILSDLKSKRDYVKKQEAIISDEIDECRKNNKPTGELELRKSVYKAKQLAIKVQMNTFYGECGNKNSPFFYVDLAASITSVGRDGLKFVIELVESKGFFVHYGDTDSVYSSAPEEVFMNWLNWYEESKPLLETNPAVIADPPALSEAIEKWAIKQTKGNTKALIPVWGDKQTDLHPDIRNNTIHISKRQRLLKEELYRRMVIIAQYEAAVLEKTINDALILRTQTRRLSMAYEEVLYTCGFFGKKKYTGMQNILPDVRLIGFDWSKKDHKFIRGLDFIKRGMAPIMREIGEEVIIKFLDIMEERPVRTVIEETIKTFANRKWEFEGFIKSAEYKPNNKSGATLLAVKRWQQEGKPIPAPGERFNFVYVKKSNNISPYGRVIPLKASDKMETPEYAKEHNLEIDIDKYMSGSIQGLLARFISYDDEFRKFTVADEPIETKADELDEEHDEDDEDDEEDKKAIHLAGKYIAKLIKNCIKGENTLTPKDVKLAATEKFNSINALLPDNCNMAFDAFKKYLLLVDAETCKNISLTPFVNHTIDTINNEILKIKINPAQTLARLIDNNISKYDIYQMFIGAKQTLTYTYKDIIMKEQNKCLSNINSMDVDINNLESIIVYAQEFNKLYLLRLRLSHIIIMTQEIFNYRKTEPSINKKVINMSGPVA